MRCVKGVYLALLSLSSFFLFVTNLLGKHYLGTHFYGALVLNILNM